MQVADPGFIGRDEPFARIRAAADDAMAGRPRAVLVTGEAGIGKTSLVRTVASSLAHDGWRVIIGRSVRMDGGGPPYLPFVQILESLLADLEPARARVVLGTARDTLTAFIPDLVPRPERVAAVTQASSRRGDPLRQARLFEALLDVGERAAAEEPLAIIVEDVQWADSGSADLLRFLVDQAHGGRIVLMVTARTDEGDAAADARLRRLLTDLDRRPGTDWIELDRLDPPDVAALARRHLAGASIADVEAIVERSGGNPLLVEELAMAAARGDDLPVGIREAMRDQLGGLDAREQRVLRAAAAMGSDLDEGSLAIVTDLTIGVVADALRTLVDRRILTVATTSSGPALAFRHPLLREVVSDSLFPAERRGLHRSIAMAATARPDVVRVAAAALAGHWEAAGAVDEAHAAARVAHAEALSVGAFSDAVRWGRAALRQAARDDATLLARVDLLRSTAEAALLIGAVDDAGTWLREAIDTAPSSLGPERAAELHARLRVARFAAGRIDEAWADAEEQLRDLADDASGPRSEALAHLAAMELARRRWPEAHALAAAAVEAADRSGLPARIALATGVLGLALVELGDEAGGLDAVRRAWAAADSVGPRGHDLAYRRLVGVLARTARFDEVVQTARSGRELARRIGLVRTLGRTLAADEASALIQVGRWTEAEAIIDAGLVEPHDDDDGDRLLVARARLLLRRDGPSVATGALDAASRVVDGPAPPADGPSGRVAPLIRRSWLEGIELSAEAAILAGRPGIALAHLAAASDAARTATIGPRSMVESGFALEHVAILALWAASERPPSPEESRLPSAAVAERVAELVPIAIGPFGAYLAASLARLRGDEDAQLERWPAVVETMSGAGLEWWAAWASLHLAEARTRAGDTDGAAGAVADASRIADVLPSVPLRSAVDRLARRMGIAIPRRVGTAESVGVEPAGAGRSPLTPREREVLALIVAGYANREIADRLAISHKTASVHVSNILAKLDVANRAEAAAVAVRLGLVSQREH